jgi:hypothetical protein
MNILESVKDGIITMLTPYFGLATEDGISGIDIDTTKMPLALVSCEVANWTDPDDAAKIFGDTVWTVEIWVKHDDATTAQEALYAATEYVYQAVKANRTLAAVANDVRLLSTQFFIGGSGRSQAVFRLGVKVHVAE